MGIEIERKFLVRSEGWRTNIQKIKHIEQGYIVVGPPTAVRVRIVDDSANINIKKATLDISRTEFEYPIPISDAKEILQHLCIGYPISKTRHVVCIDSLTWEIDVFHGKNEGLVLAEVELTSVDIPIPQYEWLGDEVSHDPRFLNTYLTLHPFSEWDKSSDAGSMKGKVV